MIIDAHAHVWPDNIAAAALSGNRLPGLSARGDGTVAGLGADMTGSGVSVSCCLGIANEARHLERVNEFVGSLSGGANVGVGTVHVERSVEENMASLRANSLRAVKIHPLFQGFSLDHPRLWDLFEAFGDQTAVIAHVGAGGDGAVNALATPRMIAQIKEQFPDLRLIACHFGGYKILDEAEDLLRGVDVVLETSWPPSLTQLRPDRVRRLIRNHGAERVVFGSDWPMTSPAEEIKAIDSLGLSDTELKRVLGGTMAEILGIESAWS